MPKIIVLGGGLVGHVIALDLARDEDLEVEVLDRDPAALGRLTALGIKARPLDLADLTAVRRAVASADVAVDAAPGHLGFQVLRTVIEAGKPCADIAFMSEDALELDGLARERGVTAVVDCGVAPGLSNLLAGRATRLLDRTDRIRILVGGLPRVRVWPWEYRIVFSATDVIEEYTRPARQVEGGEVVVRPALSDIELIDLPRVGTLEAFHTDGLRSLTRTLRVPSMQEKTLRYPGHAERIRALRETGFFDTAPLEGQSISPRDVSARLLFEAWRLPPGEADLTVLRVTAEGTRAGAPAALTWDLYDERDPATGFTSMSRTTAFPCAIAARMLARGELVRPGVLPPELLADDERLFEAFLTGLRERGIAITEAVRC